MGVIILGVAVALRRQFALLGFLGITFHQWLQSNRLITSEASTTAWIVATTILTGVWLVKREEKERV